MVKDVNVIPGGKHSRKRLTELQIVCMFMRMGQVIMEDTGENLRKRDKLWDLF
jgi:hypothetical protein